MAIGTDSSRVLKFCLLSYSCQATSHLPSLCGSEPFLFLRRATPTFLLSLSTRQYQMLEYLVPIPHTSHRPPSPLFSSPFFITFPFSPFSLFFLSFFKYIQPLFTFIIIFPLLKSPFTYIFSFQLLINNFYFLFFIYIFFYLYIFLLHFSFFFIITFNFYHF